MFVLDDPVKGLLDSATYVLGGDLGTDITDHAFDVHIRRGRATELDDISPGTCEIAFRNYDRDFDGLNTSGPYYGYLVPGRPFTVSIYGRTIFAGDIDDWDLGYSVEREGLASAPGIDGLGLLARRDFDEWTTTPQLSGARITAILDRPEIAWPGGKRSIGTGVAALQGDNVTWGSNALNYLQLVTLSERGVLFADRQGTLTFRDRHSLIGTTPLVTFRDDGTGVDFHGMTLSSAGERYFNRVGVDREGGTLQTVENDALIARDGARSLPLRGLLMDSDDQSLERASFELSLYGEPVQRVKTITVNVSALPVTDQAAVAALDIYDVIRVVCQPLDTGSTIDETSSIQYVDHSIPHDASHLMTLSLAPVLQSSVMTLDDSVLGLLDGTVGRLAF